MKENNEKSNALMEKLVHKGVSVISDSLKLKKVKKLHNYNYILVLNIGNNFKREYRVYKNSDKNELLAFDENFDFKGILSKDEALLIKSMITELNEKNINYFVPHTFFIKTDVMLSGYLIDPSCTRKRLRYLNEFLNRKNDIPVKILCSHHHPDHIGNNAGISQKYYNEIVIHPNAKAVVGKGYWHFLYNYNKLIFSICDLGKVLKRVLRLSDYKAGILGFVIRNLQPLANLIVILLTMQSIGMVRIASKRLKYLPDDKKHQIIFGKLSFDGWEIDQDFFALDVQGHASDHLVFYIKSLKCLFITDMDSFLNPAGDVTDGSINLLHQNIKKIIRLAQSERIEYLLSSHAIPVFGTDSIISYLNNYESRINGFFAVIMNIVKMKNKWEWEELMGKIFNEKSVYIQEALRVNWPKTPSNIDLYVYLFLMENGFHCIDEKEKIWEKKA